MIKRTMTKQANLMRKIAQGDSTNFDERVPSSGSDMDPNSSQGQTQPSKNQSMVPGSDQYAAVPIAEGFNQEDQYQEDVGGAPPEMINAAHSFLGPEVMQSAMGGDPTAQDLIARTAAQVGTAFMNMSNSAVSQQQAMQGGQPGMEDPNMQQQEVPQGITSPEEDLAAELVPNIPQMNQGGMNQGMAQGQPGQSRQAVVPGQEQQGDQENPQEDEQEGGQEEGQENGQENGQGNGGDNQMVDIQTVTKLINLVKKGQI